MLMATFRLCSVLTSIILMGLSIGNAEARSAQLIWDCQHQNRDVFAGLEIRYDKQLGHIGRLNFEYASAQLLCADTTEKFQCLGFWNPVERLERVELFSIDLKNNQKAAVFMPPKDYGKKEVSLLCQRRGQGL